MSNCSSRFTPRLASLSIAAVAAFVFQFATVNRAAAQRATGLDISAWQGNISQTTWNNIYSVENRQFVFLRSSRGGTTGYNHTNGGYPAANNDALNLSQRYDDPYFAQNIHRATTAGMYAGSYHFSRPDIIASTTNSNGIANSGTDEANHFMQMAGAFMRPGYLLPVHDFEAGDGVRTDNQLAQFCLDFSNQIYAVMGFRPAIYTSGNYAANILGTATNPTPGQTVAAYPTLWSARWPNQGNPNSIDVQNGHPKDSYTPIYGPWDDFGVTHPWTFWQYASTGRLQSYDNGGSNLDFDVAKGGTEFLKDNLVPAVWWHNNSGDWNTLGNWNSGQAATPPAGPPDVPSCNACTTGTGQLAPIGTLVLPTPRLPGDAGSGPAVTSGVNDTVILDRAGANITVTHAAGSHNIRKLYVREALNITGGSLSVNYDPKYKVPLTTGGALVYPNEAHSGPISAQFSGPVTLSDNGALSVYALQVDAQNTFTLAGGSLTFNTISLLPHSASPATIAMTGNMNIVPLPNYRYDSTGAIVETYGTATIAAGAGSGNSGLVNLAGGDRSFIVADGVAPIDLAINVPITNGGLIKAGTGTLSLGSVNTYTGHTSVQSGTLRIANPFLADGAGVFLANGTMLDLNYTGNDVVNFLSIGGAPQSDGIWGAVGSGAQFTSPLITGTGRLQVTSFPPPPPPPGDIIDDFEVDEGHFGWAYNLSPPSQTNGLAASTTIDRVTTDHQGAGVGSQLLNLVIDTEAQTPGSNWQIRHNSGIGAAATPAGNVPLEGTGYVGFWLKTDEAGITVRIGIDDPVGNTAIERGFVQNVISDNEWHLYQWNFEDNAHWDAFAGGADGDIDAAVNGTVTIDSIWFAGIGGAQIYLDNVSHNPDGLLTPSIVPGDYTGDGLVNSDDYTEWRSTFGNPVAIGTKADGNHNGVIDMGDYIVWRNRLSAGGGGGGSSSAAQIPEPTTALLAAAAALALVASRRR